MEKHLPYRQWLNSTYQEHFRRTHQEHFKFQVICYNILAQALLEKNGFLYEHCFWKNLKWFKRRDRLIREFLRHDADVSDRYEKILRVSTLLFRFFVYKKCKSIIMNVIFDQY